MPWRSADFATPPGCSPCDTGWPPPELLVTVIMAQRDVGLPFSRMQPLQPADVDVALEGMPSCGSSALGDDQVDGLGPGDSMLARVVSKWVLLGTILPGLSSRRRRGCARRPGPGAWG